MSTQALVPFNGSGGASLFDTGSKGMSGLPGFGNATGANIGGMGANENTFAHIPLAGQGTYTANTGGAGGLTPMNSMASGAAPIPGINTKALGGALGSTYGSGFGNYLNQLLSSMGFFPQVASAFENASLPAEARGRESIMNEFGNMGARFSSESAVGLGDFESQFALQQQQMLAQLFMNGMNQTYGLVNNMLPGMQSSYASQQGGLFSDIMGGLQAAAPYIMMAM